MTATLRYYHREAEITVLGPGQRAVIWLQGCPHRCRGCIIPESWPVDEGLEATCDEICDWLLRCKGIEGITFSGGEPMLQARALNNVLESVLAKRNLGVVLYTGYRFEWLQEQAAPEQLRLLSKIDLLIDGLYEREQHADLLWRGSLNQRLLPLSDRYKGTIPAPGSPQDRSAGLTFRVSQDASFQFFGVPSQPGFRQELERRLRADGVELNLSCGTGPSAAPFEMNCLASS